MAKNAENLRGEFLMMKQDLKSLNRKEMINWFKRKLSRLQVTVFNWIYKTV